MILLEFLGVLVLCSYLVGSIPFGLILTRLAGLGDLRTIGSGSIGATNVLRTGHKGIALATVLLDAAKGAIVVLYVASFGDEGFVEIAGLAVVLGHCTCIWLRFRGGKGVATGLGVILVWAWPIALACCAIWAATAALTRRSSVASLTAVAAAPLLMLAFEPHGMAVFTLLICLLIVARHHANIRRLIAGTEPRIGAS